MVACKRSVKKTILKFTKKREPGIPPTASRVYLLLGGMSTRSRLTYILEQVHCKCTHNKKNTKKILRFSLQPQLVEHWLWAPLTNTRLHCDMFTSTLHIAIFLRGATHKSLPSKSTWKSGKISYCRIPPIFRPSYFRLSTISLIMCLNFVSMPFLLRKSRKKNFFRSKIGSFSKKKYSNNIDLCNLNLNEIKYFIFYVLNFKVYANFYTPYSLSSNHMLEI